MEDTVMETVSQTSVQEDSDVRVRNAPALPAAPTYSGATMQERRVFTSRAANVSQINFSKR
jgi:hypothetical protein